MQQNVKICPYCGCVGGPDYVFCAKCGRTLPLTPEYTPPAAWQATSSSPYQAAEPVTQATATVEPTVSRDDVYECCHDGGRVMYEKELDGVPTAEVSDYIGKNRNRILPKFFKQSYGAKGGWNWMVFLFGVLGVPFVWFFYRKMKKQGVIALLLTFALTACTALTYGVAFGSLEEPATEYFETVAELNQEYGYYDEYDFSVPFVNPESTDTAYQQEAEAAFDDYMATAQKDDVFAAMSMLSQMISFLQLGLAVVLAMFADRWYYKKAMADIKALNQFGTPDYETVMSTGGTKTSSAVLSGILGGLAQVLLTVLLMIPFMLPVIESVMDIIL